MDIRQIIEDRLKGKTIVVRSFQPRQVVGVSIDYGFDCGDDHLSLKLAPIKGKRHEYVIGLEEDFEIIEEQS